MAFHPIKITIKNTDGVKTFPAIRCVNGVQIKMDKNNTGIILFGEGSPDSDMFPLEANDVIFFPVLTANQIVFKTLATDNQTLYGMII